MKIFRYVGWLFLAVLILWITSDLLISRGAMFPPKRSVSSLGLGFEGTEALPAATIKAAIEQANQAIKKAHASTVQYSVASRITDWISFGITAIITILAGSTTHSSTAGSGVAAQPAATPVSKRFAKLVGALAAAATVITGASGKLDSMSKDRYAQEEKLDEATAKFQRDIKLATTTTEAQNILDDFNRMLLRLE